MFINNEKDDVAILIPMYNEEKTIAKVINDFSMVLPEKSCIYVYDNNSTDKSYEIASNTNKAIIRKESRQGKGNVVRTMFKEINANFYVLVDADDTYDAKDLKKILSALKEDKVDMVIGDRLTGNYFSENKRRFHNFGNKFVCFFINFLFKSNIKDVMTGYRGFSRNFVKTYPVLSKNFEVETEMTIHALHYNLLIKNIPINYKDRPYGSTSKLNTFADGIKVIVTIIHMFIGFRPMTTLGIVGVVFFVLSIMEIIYIIISKNISDTKFLSLKINSFALLIIAIVFLLSGLILHYVIELNKKSFELKQRNI